MNNYRKSLLVAGGVLTLGVAGAGVGATASALTNTNNNKHASLVDALAKKFNVDKSEVQKVFDEDHATHESEMKTSRETALKKALTDKKITQEQYEHIEAAWKELDTARSSAGDPSSQTEQQRTEMRKKMDDLRTWMQQQNISPETLGMTHGFGRHHDGGRPN